MAVHHTFSSRRQGVKKKHELTKSHLYSHVSHNSSLMAFQGLQGNLGYLRLTLAKEHLASCCQHLFVLSLDLHLCWGKPNIVRKEQVLSTLEPSLSFWDVSPLRGWGFPPCFKDNHCSRQLPWGNSCGLVTANVIQWLKKPGKANTMLKYREGRRRGGRVQKQIPFCTRHSTGKDINWLEADASLPYFHNGISKSRVGIIQWRGQERSLVGAILLWKQNAYLIL